MGTVSVGCCVSLVICHGDFVINVCVRSVIVQVIFLLVLLNGCSVSQNSHTILTLELN